MTPFPVSRLLLGGLLWLATQTPSAAQATTAGSPIGNQGQVAALAPAKKTIINRRTYHTFHNKYEAELALAVELKELTKTRMGKDIRILQSTYGEMGVIALEFEFDTWTELLDFFAKWHPMIREKDLIRKWFENVESAKNEIWSAQ